MANPGTPNEAGKPRRQIEDELDRLEAKIGELRMLYEQYFVDILPRTPDKLRAEVIRMIRHLLRAPFRNSATRFRLRMLVHRYQTYATYWERVMKQKEDGTYSRDLFKAELREQLQELEKVAQSAVGVADRGLKQLFDTYETALRKSGGDAKSLNFDSFKKNLLKQAKQLKDKTGAKKLSYRIVVKDGRVIVKASAK